MVINQLEKEFVATCCVYCEKLNIQLKSNTSVLLSRKRQSIFLVSFYFNEKFLYRLSFNSGQYQLFYAKSNSLYIIQCLEVSEHSRQISRYNFDAMKHHQLRSYLYYGLPLVVNLLICLNLFSQLL